MELHRDVLVEFGARQDATDDVLPAAKQTARAVIATLAKRNPKPLDEIRGEQAILTQVERQTLVARSIQHTLRQIGDGIAWRSLGFDRRAFTVLGKGPRVGRLSRGIGRDAELEELARLWEEEKVFAVHNDMTNCLRHGDLTAIRVGRDGPEITLIEVKAGARSAKPQLERLKRSTDLLRQGRDPIGADGRPIEIDFVPARYRTFLADLAPLIRRAKLHGHAWLRPTPSLLVGAVDYRVWGSQGAEMVIHSNEMRAKKGWAPGRAGTVDWIAALRRMRDRKESFASLAPLTLLPLPAEDVADVVMGFIDLAYSIDLECLARTLAQQGIEVTLPRVEQSGSQFFEAFRGRAGVVVPATLREQMMVELMTPCSLYRCVDHTLQSVEANPRRAGESRVVVFAEESVVWDPPPGGWS